jgi:hypothetical protein
MTGYENHQPKSEKMNFQVNHLKKSQWGYFSRV